MNAALNNLFHVQLRDLSAAIHPKLRSRDILGSYIDSAMKAIVIK